MIANKKEFGGGLLLFVGFWVVFAIGMMPIFNNHNILDYMDNLYNSISKSSVYYVPNVQKKVDQYRGQQIDFTLKVASSEQADRFAKLLAAANAKVTLAEQKLKVNGDMGAILDNMLTDADAMFVNNGKQVADKYGYDERQALYDSWTILSGIAKDMEKQKKFEVGKVFQTVQTKAVEPAYNYYGIQAESIKAKIGIVVASLIGYVVYTLWFGFSIMFMFEGWGLRLKH